MKNLTSFRSAERACTIDNQLRLIFERVVVVSSSETLNMRQMKSARQLSTHYICCLLFLLLLLTVHAFAVAINFPKTSLVTGANGYIGRAIVHELLAKYKREQLEHEIICLVRPQRVVEEEAYWAREQQSAVAVRVMPFDMVDGGTTLEAALATTTRGGIRCVYHVASVFGPTSDHVKTAHKNVKGTEDVVGALQRARNCKLVLTSSMAAVRGTGQDPLNGKFYTQNDWNTVSQLGANWGASYQWSKMESERRAWILCHDFDIPMVSLCPSFVFGPPKETSGSYSLMLVNQWIRGESPVQSRLFVDVRDVAKAHVEAGMRPVAEGNRYLVSTEARIPSQEIAEWIKEVCKRRKVSDPEKVHFDKDFQGGAIPIGQKELDSTVRLEKELSVRLRPVKETIVDMVTNLLQQTAMPPKV